MSHQPADKLRGYIEDIGRMDSDQEKALAELDGLEQRAATVAEPTNKVHLRTIEFLLGEVERLEHREAEAAELLRVVQGRRDRGREWVGKRDRWFEDMEPVREVEPVERHVFGDDWLAELEQGES